MGTMRLPALTQEYEPMILPGSLISQRWLLLASWCLHDKCSISQMLALLRIHYCASLDVLLNVVPFPLSLRLSPNTTSLFADTLDAAASTIMKQIWALIRTDMTNGCMQKGCCNAEQI